MTRTMLAVATAALLAGQAPPPGGSTGPAPQPVPPPGTPVPPDAPSAETSPRRLGRPYPLGSAGEGDDDPLRLGRRHPAAVPALAEPRTRPEPPFSVFVVPRDSGGERGARAGGRLGASRSLSGSQPGLGAQPGTMGPTFGGAPAPSTALQ
jgi:hypothetical protein